MVTPTTEAARRDGGMGKKEIKRRLDAMVDSLNDERLRWLIGKGISLVEKGEIKPEEYETLIENILRTEMERKMIINELKSGPLIVSEISKHTQLLPKQTFRHLMALKRLNVVAIIGEREGELEFRLL